MIFKTVGRIIRWSGEYKKRLFLGCLFSFFSSFTIVSPTMLAAWTFGKVVEAWRTGSTLEARYVWLSIAGILFFILIRFWFSYMRACLQESIGYEKAAEERIAIGETLKKVSLGYFTRVPSGEILTGLTTQLSTLELQGLKIIDTVLNGYIQLLAVVLFLLFLSPVTALVAVLGTCASYLVLSAVNLRTRRTYGKAHKAEEDMAGSVIEFIHGLPILKSFGSSSGGMRNYRQACLELKKIRIGVEIGFIPWNTLHLLVLKLASVWIILICSLQALRGDMSIAMYLMFMMFSFTIFAGAENVNDAAYLLATVDAAMDKLDSLAKEEAIDRDGQDLELSRFDVELQHVSFGYDEGRQILSDISLTIPQGTVTAIVGPSGSGKTTLCSLIARFYDVTEGRILVGGTDIRRLTCDSLLRHISMVFQNVYLFEDTIRSNIRFGRPDASDSEVEAAARAARCHDFIMQLPQGYDTVIGEGGSTLSGGERQRLSIARAILKQAPIVILDEATASIDPENEHLIQEAISALTEGKTIITIAHRLPTIEHADQIIVLEEGRIVQTGTHAQLMRQEGLYQRFVKIREKTESWII